MPAGRSVERYIRGKSHANRKMRPFDLIVLAGIVCVLGQATEDASERVPDPSTIQKKVEKMLDWTSYRNIFKKQYSSVEQELVRQKIYLARALDVFKTSCKYMMNMMSHWHSINKFSDWTLEESARILRGDATELRPEDWTAEELAGELLLERWQEQQAARRGASSFRGPFRSGFPLARAHSVMKRDVRGLKHVLSTSDLIKTDRELPAPVTLVQEIIPSNNPDYEPVKALEPLERAKVRLANDIPPTRFQDTLTVVESVYDSSLVVMRNGFNKLLDVLAGSSGAGHVAPASIVLQDWRRSGCVGPVKSQEICNSCYAMSSTSYMEWALCMNQGNVLTPLSVQYMVSCGRQFSEESGKEYKLNGCNSGITRHAGYFFREYGLELEANLGYLDFETECPVTKKSSKKLKGYIRPNIKEPIRLSPSTGKLDMALMMGPVVVSMNVPNDFLQHGGGLLDYCDPNTGHSMLIVGSGVESGVEYLLIKNSFGTGWGYDGYFKFDRSATENCVKEFISPSVSFPSEKSQARHIKAYLAHRSNSYGPEEDFHGINSDEIQKLYEQA